MWPCLLSLACAEDRSTKLNSAFPCHLWSRCTSTKQEIRQAEWLMILIGEISVYHSDYVGMENVCQKYFTRYTMFKKMNDTFIKLAVSHHLSTSDRARGFGLFNKDTIYMQIIQLSKTYYHHSKPNKTLNKKREFLLFLNISPLFPNRFLHELSDKCVCWYVGLSVQKEHWDWLLMKVPRLLPSGAVWLRLLQTCQLSVGEITPTQISTNLFCLTYLCPSLLFISGWGAVFLSSNEARTIHCSVQFVRDYTQTQRRLVS